MIKTLEYSFFNGTFEYDVDVTTQDAVSFVYNERALDGNEEYIELADQYDAGEIDENYILDEIWSTPEFEDWLKDIHEDEAYSCSKKEDSYHYSIPFEYIEKNNGDDEPDMATAHMEVDVVWDDYQNGYVITYSCPEEDDIDSDEGNGPIEEFWDSVLEEVYRILEEEEDISRYAIVD